MSTKRRIRVTSTRSFLVDVPAEEAERLTELKDLGGNVVHTTDGLDVIEAAARFLRRTNHAPEYVDADVRIEPADDGDLAGGYWEPTVLDATAPGAEGYLWSACHFVDRARQELSSGRYREGHCPDLDALNRDFGRLQERLRVMALAVDDAIRKAAPTP